MRQHHPYWSTSILSLSIRNFIMLLKCVCLPCFSLVLYFSSNVLFQSTLFLSKWDQRVLTIILSISISFSVGFDFLLEFNGTHTLIFDWKILANTNNELVERNVWKRKENIKMSFCFQKFQEQFERLLMIHRLSFLLILLRRFLSMIKLW